MWGGDRTLAAPLTTGICIFAADGVAHVAQSVERVLGKDEVTGSIPVVGCQRY